VKNAKKTKFVSEVNLDNMRVKAYRPFKVSSENQRKFIRLEIMAPMSVNRVKDIFGNYWPEGDATRIDGTILNISSGGVLVEIQERLNEGDVVALTFTLQGVEEIGNVLGIVKRTDDEEDYQLAGIEFVKREMLADRLTDAELDILQSNYSNFKDTVQDVLRNYVYTESETV